MLQFTAQAKRLWNDNRQVPIDLIAREQLLRICCTSRQSEKVTLKDVQEAIKEYNLDYSIN